MAPRLVYQERSGSRAQEVFPSAHDIALPYTPLQTRQSSTGEICIQSATSFSWRAQMQVAQHRAKQMRRMTAAFRRLARCTEVRQCSAFAKALAVALSCIEALHMPACPFRSRATGTLQDPWATRCTHVHGEAVEARHNAWLHTKYGLDRRCGGRG